MAEQRRIAIVDGMINGHLALLLLDGLDKAVVSVDRLPEGATDGTWLRVRLNGNALIGAEVDHERAEQMRSRVRSKMDELRKRERM